MCEAYWFAGVGPSKHNLTKTAVLVTDTAWVENACAKNCARTTFTAVRVSLLANSTVSPAHSVQSKHTLLLRGDMNGESGCISAFMADVYAAQVENISCSS